MASRLLGHAPAGPQALKGFRLCRPAERLQIDGRCRAARGFEGGGGASARHSAPAGRRMRDLPTDHQLRYDAALQDTRNEKERWPAELALPELVKILVAGGGR